MRSISLYVKHSGSRLLDAHFDVGIDDDKRLVVVRIQPFDSALTAHLVTAVLPIDFGVVAFDDDNLSGPGRARAIRLGSALRRF